MRLLHREDGHLALTADLQEAKGSYAILSHTWLDDAEEVQFGELQTANHKKGFRKLEFLLDQAEKDGLQYGWADTCCIDKRSNTELGEALNRMFEWYRDAEVCYVYLIDVPRVRFEESRWFTRGWTLQELIAPKVVKFFDNNGQYLGDKANSNLAHHIEAVTGINQPLNETPIPERFKWILSRCTKKPEDKSYCMIGLLDIRLMSNYGEGAERAMDRLIEEIGNEHGRKVERECKRFYAAGQVSKEDQPTDVEIRKEFLQSLFFEGMFSRQDTIEDPYLDTCTWLLSHRDFMRWQQRELAFLWIKAKAGAGKSTLMRFATTSDATALSFFFNARGSELEKSTSGMYRSILWQLAKKMPHLCFSLDEEKIWTVRKLKTTTKQFVLKLAKPLSFYIDALDECRNEDVQDMVYFFNDLSKLSANFYVCFASRYYPSITVKDSIELRLEAEPQHGQDLRSWITGRLDIAGDFREQVIKKANGIFFWAILVIPILNQEISRGNAHNLEARLHELPQDIYKLLEELVSGADKQFSIAMQILAFTRSPLSLEDYFIATMIGLELDETVQPWRKTTFSQVMLERFLSSSTRGLAEMTRGSTQTVQFIHETVRDFLLDHAGMQKIMIGEYSPSKCHDLMKKICYSYLVSTDTSVVTGLGRRQPFVQYAVKNCLQHADSAADIDQADFLRKFDTGKYVDVFKYLNYHPMFKELKSPRLTIDLMYQLACAGTPRLIEIARSLGLEVNSCHVCAAIDTKALMSLQGLVKQQEVSSDTITTGTTQQHDHDNSNTFIDLNQHTFDGSSAIIYALRGLSDSFVSPVMKRLIELGADPNATDNNGCNALHIAAGLSNASNAIKCLLNSGVDVDARDCKGRTALMHNFANVSDWSYHELFLEHNAAIDIQDESGSTALMLFAARPKCRRKQIKQMEKFLKHNPDIQAKNHLGKTAIIIAKEAGNAKLAELLSNADASTSLLLQR